MPPGSSIRLLTDDAKSYCWGFGGLGGLGSGDTSDRSTPVAVVPGAMVGPPCADGWTLRVADNRCLPGSEVSVVYQLRYLQRDWSSPVTTITPAWTAPEVAPRAPGEDFLEGFC